MAAVPWQLRSSKQQEVMESLSPSAERPGWDPAPGQPAKHSLAEGTGTGCKEHVMGTLGSANPAGQSFMAAVLIRQRDTLRGNLDTSQLLSTPNLLGQGHPCSGWFWGGQFCLCILPAD